MSPDPAMVAPGAAPGTGVTRAHERVLTGCAAGFSLLEMTIVLLIVALLLGGMLNPLGALLDARKRTQAQAQLEQIREALLGFAMAYGHLPCPSTTEDPTSADYGMHDPACDTDRTTEGYLPWRALGLAEVDPWGISRSASGAPFNGYWRYRVDRNFSNPLALIAITTAPAENLSIQDGNGTLLTAPTETPVALVYSTGANLVPDGENADYEGAPCGNASGHARGGSRACPDGEPLYQAGAVGAGFDDLMVWISRPRLFNTMVMAGRLP